MTDTVEVLQREFGIADHSLGHRQIATTGVTTCTIWIGWDNEGKYAFLAHFDYPWTTGAVPTVLNELLARVPPKTNFSSILVGGRRDRLRWSNATRARIAFEVDTYKRQHPELNLTIKPGAFIPIFHRRGYAHELGSMAFTRYSKKPLIRSAKDQRANTALLWRIWQPMQRANGSALPPDQISPSVAPSP